MNTLVKCFVVISLYQEFQEVCRRLTYTVSLEITYSEMRGMVCICCVALFGKSPREATISFLQFIETTITLHFKASMYVKSVTRVLCDETKEHSADILIIT